MLSENLTNYILELPQSDRIDLIERIEHSIGIEYKPFTPYFKITDTFDRDKFGFPIGATGVYVYRMDCEGELGNPFDEDVLYIGCCKAKGNRGMRSRQKDVIGEMSNTLKLSQNSFASLFLKHHDRSDLDSLCVSYSPQPRQVAHELERVILTHYKHTHGRMPICQSQDFKPVDYDSGKMYKFYSYQQNRLS